MMQTSPPIGIGSKVYAIFKQIVSSNENEGKRDYTNYEWLLLNEQFMDVTEIVMENTFFNIVQETTHQENDFLRVSKKFIQANKL